MVLQSKETWTPIPSPILAFLGSQYVVNLWNRSGDMFAGQQAKEFLSQTVAALGAKFKTTRVICDSGFYLIDFIKHLESACYSYIIAALMSQILQRQIHHINQWREVSGGVEVMEFDFEHLNDKWDKPRRYIVIRQEINKRPKAPGKQLSLFKDMEQWKEDRFSAYITNDRSTVAEEIWRQYRPRATEENVIKDLKEGYGLAAFSMHNFWATEAMMVTNALVFHNLIHYLNKHILNVNKPQQQLRTLFYHPGTVGKQWRVFSAATRRKRQTSTRQNQEIHAEYLENPPPTSTAMQLNQTDGIFRQKSDT